MRSLSLVAFASMLAACAGHSLPQELPLESYESSIGYASVSDALTALQSKAGVQIQRQADGWTRITEWKSGEVLANWYFAPPGDPAYPTVMKAPVDRDLRIRCEATKVQCDDFVRRRREAVEKTLKEI